MGQTVCEKILSAHAGRPVAASEIVIVPVDAVMATDATAPFAIKAFEEMGGTRLWGSGTVPVAFLPAGGAR